MRTEVRVTAAEWEIVASWGTCLSGTFLYTSLLTDNRMEIGIRSLNLWTSDPTRFKQSVQQLSKKVNGRKDITFEDKFWKKKQLSPCLTRESCNRGQNRAHKVFPEATAFVGNLSIHKIAVVFIRCCQHSNPLQEMLLLDCCKTKRVWKHIRLTFFNNGKCTAQFNFWRI